MSTHDALADMTRQRDDAVKAFQRERAKVVRVEAMIDDFRHSPMNRDYCRHVADSFQTALDRPDAPQAPVHDAEVAGEGSGGQNAVCSPYSGDACGNCRHCRWGEP